MLQICFFFIGFVIEILMDYNILTMVVDLVEAHDGFSMLQRTQNVRRPHNISTGIG